MGSSDKEFFILLHYLVRIASIKQMYIDLIVMWHAIDFKQFIFVANYKGHKQKAFQTDDMEIRYNCVKRYHVLYINCATGKFVG